MTAVLASASGDIPIFVCGTCGNAEDPIRRTDNEFQERGRRTDRDAQRHSPRCANCLATHDAAMAISKGQPENRSSAAASGARGMADQPFAIRPPGQSVCGAGKIADRKDYIAKMVGTNGSAERNSGHGGATVVTRATPSVERCVSQRTWNCSKHRHAARAAALLRELAAGRGRGGTDAQMPRAPNFPDAANALMRNLARQPRRLLMVSGGACYSEAVRIHFHQVLMYPSRFLLAIGQRPRAKNPHPTPSRDRRHQKRVGTLTPK